MYHPDVNATLDNRFSPNSQKFKDVAEAYSILSVEESRVGYDQGTKKQRTIILDER